MWGARRQGSARRNGLAAGISLVLVAMAVLVPPAAATRWHRVTTLGSSTNEVSTLRIGNVLHVAWSSTNSGGDSLHDTKISGSGKLLGAHTIASGWAGISNPALVHTPGSGLDAIWGGQHTTQPGDPNQSMNSAISLNGGKTWTLKPANVVNPSSHAYDSPAAAANEVGTAQTPIMTWYTSSGVWVHAGLSSSTPNYNFQPFGCCGNFSNIAVNGAGRVKLAWFSNKSGHLGLWTQTVGDDGSRVGSPHRLPGTGNMSDAPIQRVGLVARVRGGFYVAFPTGSPSTTRIVLWRVGNKHTRTIAHVNHTDAHASIATDAKGRLWVFWEYSTRGHPHLYARRSNRAATRWGVVVKAGAPRHAGAMYSVDGNAGNRALDVFANTAIGYASKSATWTRHIYPGLTLKASRRALIRHHRTKVTFRVSDAGSAVKGAKVHFAGRTKKTNSHGKAKFRVTASHRLKATATHAHYTKATLRLKVKR